MTTALSPTIDRVSAIAGAPATCRHCGDACTGLLLANAHGTFCCAGCAGVYTLLQEHGLADFYRCAPDGVGSRPDDGPASSSRFAVLDDALASAQFLDGGDGTWRYARFTVPAIHCASCLWLLERLWRLEPGVGTCDVDLGRRTVRIAFRPGETTLRRIAERMTALGYAPALDPDHRPAMPASRRVLYSRIGVAAFAAGNMMLFSIPRSANGAPLESVWQHLFDALNVLLALPVLLYAAQDFLVAGWRACRVRHITLDVPVALGLLVLFGRSLFDILTGRGAGFLDAFAGLVLFLLIGRLFQQVAFDRIAFDRTARSFLPMSVHVASPTGTGLRAIDDLTPGDVMVLRPGEVVPADASVEGDGVVDLAFVTGEQAPVDVRRGEVVVAGARVVGAPLRLRVVRAVSHSRLASLWQASSDAHKPLPRLTALSTRFGQAFTVVALGLAVAGFMAWWPDVGAGAQVATAVLIIACPCALTLAAPVTLGTAAGCLGRAGVFLKTPAVAFDLARVDTVVFDKTGTLTQAEAPAIVDLHELDAAQWAIVRQLAGVSTHPVSRALAGSSPVDGDVRHVHERAGAGIVGEVAGIRVALGTAPFVEQISGQQLSAVAGRTYASVGDRAGWLTSTTPARPGATEMIAAVSQLTETWLVSGDHDGTMPHWRPLFSDRQRFQQAPEDKQRFVDQLQADGRHVLMIGDGLNDAAALGSASVGIAVADHAACLVPACDVVVSGEALQWLPEVLQYARRASRVIALCLAVSVLYNLVGLYLALTGALTPLVTAILMPVSSLTIVGLSTGLMRVRVPRRPS